MTKELKSYIYKDFSVLVDFIKINSPGSWSMEKDHSRGGELPQRECFCSCLAPSHKTYTSSVMTFCITEIGFACSLY